MTCGKWLEVETETISMFQIRFNQKGFTLIELTFSMAIMLTVATASYTLLTTFHHHYRLQEAMAEMQQQARVSEDLIFREVLQTGYDPTGNLFEPLLNKRTRGTSRVGCDTTLPKEAEPILEATPVAFHFLTDLNENGSVDQGVDIDEDIRYEWVGESSIDSCGIKKAPFTLYRDTGGGAHGQEVSVNVDEFVLTYFDEKGGSFPPVALTSEARAGIRKVIATFRVRSAWRSNTKDPNNHTDGGFSTRRIVREIGLKNR